MMLLRAALAAIVACQSAPTEELLPAPTGPHKTGRMSFHWRDAKRDELETAASGDKRELMVHVFYPADAQASGTRAPYMPDADLMSPPFTAEQLPRVQSLRAYSLENARPLSGARHPVVILSPGGGMKGLTYHVLAEDLASHGWVVAAIDPPYNARAVRMLDGRVLGNLSPAERGWPRPNEPTAYAERVEHWGRDVSFVIDQLTELDRGRGLLGARLDLQRGVGVVGHSRGGQAAGAARVLDPRVRAGINLDGTAGDRPILPVNGDTLAGAQPFLWIQKTLEAPSDAQLQRAGRTRAQFETEVARITGLWHTRLSQISGGALRVYLTRPGIQHIDFSDEPFWDGTMTADLRPGRLQTIAEARAWVRAFFDGTVRGQWTDLKRLVGEPGKTRDDVTAFVFGRMWP